jgi:NCS1 family nucleobase:cation symporter-1
MVGASESRLPGVRRFVERADDALSPAELTSLWVAVTLGVPVAVVGYMLMVGTSFGGLELSATQLLLAVPLGVVIAVGVLWVAARPGSIYGEGLGVLLKPSFGTVGAGLYLVLHAAFLIVLAALELRVVGVVLVAAVGDLGPFTLPDFVGVAIASLAAVGLAIGGALRWWVRRVAFWGGLATAMWIVWRLAAELDLEAARAQTPSPWFWLGVDMIVGLSVLFFPLIVDTTRALPDERSAPAAVGAGFGVSALIVLMAGGLAAATSPGIVDPAQIVTKLGGPLAGVGAALALLAWVVFAESDGAPLFLVMPTRALASLGLDPPRWVAIVAGPAAATAVAMMTTARDLFGVLAFLMSFLTPILGVFLSDFYLVRGGAYMSRDLYRRGGVYRGINLAAVLSLLLGFVVYQWVTPVGADWWVRFLTDGLPGAPLSQFGVPGVVASLAVSALAYTVAGRFLVREESYVSHVRKF